MDKAKAAVASILGRAGHHDTTVDESVRPAVTEETIKPTRHEEITEAVDREVHQDHDHTTVQPIQHQEVKPEVHSQNMAPVQYRSFEHGDVSQTQQKLESEAARFSDTSRSADTQFSTSAAPVVEGEHVHHHVHEQVQPVIHKETIAPEVVHTTVPIHEKHIVAAEHHGTSVLPTTTMSDFQAGGGSLTGGATQAHEKYEGDPRPYNPAMQAERTEADKNFAAHDGLHDHQRALGITGGGGADPRLADDRGASGTSTEVPPRAEGHSAGAATGAAAAAPMAAAYEVGEDRATSAGSGMTGTGTSGLGTSSSGVTGSGLTGADSAGSGMAGNNGAAASVATGESSTPSTGFSELGHKRGTPSQGFNQYGAGGPHSGISDDRSHLESGNPGSGITNDPASASSGNDAPGTAAAAGTVGGVTGSQAGKERSEIEQGASRGGLLDGNAGTTIGTGRDQVDNAASTTNRDTSSTAASAPPSKMADDTATKPEKGVDNIKDDSAPPESSDTQSSAVGNDPATIESSGKKLTGTGAPGSHSALFGLTPDGHKETDVNYDTSKPPQDNSGGNEASGDTGSRAPEGQGVSEQMNDPKVAEKGHNGQAVEDSSSGKPGAGTGVATAEQGSGTVGEDA